MLQCASEIKKKSTSRLHFTRARKELANKIIGFLIFTFVLVIQMILCRHTLLWGNLNNAAIAQSTPG